MKTKNSLTILTVVIVVYLLLALIWWAILLSRKNNEIYQVQVDNVKLYQEKTLGINEYDTSKDAKVQTLTKEYQKQQWMILGEGLFFGISLILGIGFIVKSSQQIVATNKQQNNFLLAITHELKTPVSSVKLILQTLQKRLLTQEQINTLSQNGLEENQRLEYLIDNILLSTKIIDGYQFHIEEIKMASLVNDSIKSFAKRLKDRKIILTNESSDDLTIKGDYNALLIAINNLLDNAIKYSSDNIRILITKQDDRVLLSVNDLGPGIAKSEIPHIFKKFYRPGNEETRDSKGTGLGLYLVKEIIEAHKGTVFYKKADTRGSTFIIEIPKAS